jgi:4-amino-4-deoxy-L-arabinose transferase-like glycosyltransferase
LAVYAFVKKLQDGRAALFSALLLGTNYLWLTYNRVAFVESFQAALITLAYLSVAAATRQRAWAVLGGVAYALAAMAKISAIASVAGIGVFWAWQFVWPTDEADALGSRLKTFTTALLFGISAVLAALTAWLLLVRPNQEVFAAASKHLVGLASGRSSPLGIMTLGLGQTVKSDRPITSMFVIHNALWLVCVVLVAIRQLAIPRQSRDATDRLCWCWLVFCLLTIGLKHFDHDRRYLQLLPPMAILMGTELARSGLTIPSRDELLRRVPRWRGWACLGLVAVMLGFSLRCWLANRLLDLEQTWQSGTQRSFGAPGAAALAWIAISVPALMLLLGVVRWLPARRAQFPAWTVLTVLVGLDLAKAGFYASDLSYHLPDAARQLADIGQRLPPNARVVVGDTSDTLGLGSNCFTFIIRYWAHNNSYMNLDGWERFAPNVAIAGQVPAGFVHLTDLTLAPPRPHETRTVVPVYVRATLADLVKQPAAAQLLSADLDRAADVGRQ